MNSSMKMATLAAFAAVPLVVAGGFFDKFAAGGSQGGQQAPKEPQTPKTPQTDNARRFVVCDPLLRTPAVCYRLEPGWDAIGWIRWNAAARSNQFSSSVVLYNPSAHMIVQTVSPVHEGQQLLDRNGAEWSNPNLMAQKIADRINPGIVVPGLSSFTPKGGRFTDDVPEKIRKIADEAKKVNRVQGLTYKLFKVECFFDCMYGGVPCEAKYEFVSLYHYSKPMPRLPAIGWSIDYDTQLIVAPPGRLADAAREGGRIIAGAFVNQAWKIASDRMMLAIATGQAIGANEGWELMKQAQADTSRTMDRVRIGISEQIREVKTVDNPFSPGEKFERPIHFDHSWLNSSQDTLLLSDRNLEPNTMRGLIEMGYWLPVD
jgi:hypothetical protein